MLEPQQNPLPSGGIQLSVIIPALNEEAMIARTLASLADSDFPPDAYEVVLVDNGSSDRTIAVARAFASRLRLTILERPGVNVSALRNLGAAVASGEVLAFLDADCLVPRHWMVSACRHLQSASSGVIGGSIDVSGDCGWVGRTWYRVGYAPKDGPVTYVPSGNLLIRREDFVRLGGFNENLKTSEDCEFCFRARRNGLPVMAIAEMAVVHLRTPQTLWEFYRRERWHGTHVAKVFFANLRERANLRAVLLAVLMLVCAGAVLAGLLTMLLLRSYGLVAAGLGGIVTITFFCAIRRLRHMKGRDFWSNLPPLALLHAVWGLARAQSLLSVRSIYPRAVSNKARTKDKERSQCAS
jgi:glycosyltransferase involved in cell wall biosynthesis